MSNSSWYARNVPKVLGQPAAPAYPQQPASPSLPPTTPAPVQQPPAPPAQDAPPGQMHITDAIARWKGGAGNAETATCPRCGSRNVFSRANAAIITSSGASASPAPHCYECGWNGLWEQFSDQFSD